jgi:polyisoprenyl-teichoic acid--peptidoglycan teichoic acid transferase
MIKKRRIKIILVILAVIAAAAVGGYGYVYSQLSKIKHVDIPKTNDELSINEDEDNTASQNDDIVNIALFAVDTAQNNEPYSSDTIMILSIDKFNKTIKLVSILRDTLVNVDGYGMKKINTAYALGGPTLALKTLNSNFDLNIKEYATVNFEGFTKIIDALGGIEINVKEYEVPYLLTFGIKSSGAYNLDGEEALMYCWIRQAGDGDFERTERQRIVLEKIYEKIKGAGISQYPSLVSAILPYTETSLTTTEIIDLGMAMLKADVGTMEQARFPIVGYYRMDLNDYSLVTDLEGTTTLMHKFIYGE